APGGRVMALSRSIRRVGGPLRQAAAGTGRKRSFGGPDSIHRNSSTILVQMPSFLREDFWTDRFPCLGYSSVIAPQFIVHISISTSCSGGAPENPEKVV